MTQRDWISSPSPRDPAPVRERDGEPWEDGIERMFPTETEPMIETAPFMCRCKCGCQNVAEHGLFCSNCDPNGVVL